jgi:hypothetical protein
VRPSQHQGAPVARGAPIGWHTVEQVQEVRVVLLVRRVRRGEATSADARRAGQGIDLEPGVVRENELVREPRVAERLPRRVLVERRAVFGDLVVDPDVRKGDELRAGRPEQFP